MIYALSSIAAILSGVFAAMGFGGGSIFIIYLTLFENLPQTLAQGINLIFFIPCMKKIKIIPKPQMILLPYPAIPQEDRKPHICPVKPL